MGSIERRLERLEEERKDSATRLTQEALKAHSDEDLDALEESVEDGLKQGVGDFWDLYRVTKERGRRGLEVLFDAHEAVRRGEEPRASPASLGRYHLELVERIQAGDKEACKEWEQRDGYRIWKYYRK
jgi:hypothetical protein